MLNKSILSNNKKAPFNFDDFDGPVVYTKQISSYAKEDILNMGKNKDSFLVGKS